MTEKSKQLEIDVSYKLPFFTDLKGRVAIISGATRGIGRACALKLAKLGCHVVVAAKTVKEQPTLPGTIYSVAEECSKLGPKSIGFQIDMRNVSSLKACVDKTVETFGRVDIVINNASALWWQDIVDTPVSKYDLITQINVRGTFFLTQFCLPHMEKNNFGRVITMSPQIKLHGFGGFTAYNISKFGMTMVALGVHEEYFMKGKNITSNSLWPATVVESSASINFEMGEKKFWRKPEVLADSVIGLVCAPGPNEPPLKVDKSVFGPVSGEMLIDEDFLRERGLNDENFVRYRCDPNFEPPRLLASKSGQSGHGGIKRGSVRRLTKDKAKSTSKL